MEKKTLKLIPALYYEKELRPIVKFHSSVLKFNLSINGPILTYYGNLSTGSDYSLDELTHLNGRYISRIRHIDGSEEKINLQNCVSITKVDIYAIHRNENDEKHCKYFVVPQGAELTFNREEADGVIHPITLCELLK